MADEEFATLKVFYDGDPLKYVTSIEETTNSGRNRVDIMEVGLAGFTPGSGDKTISVGFVMPKAGTEKDFESDCAEGRTVTLQVQKGRRYYIGPGIITDVSISGSAGANVEGSFNWTGVLKPNDG